ncbi:NADP-dependent oxidoreductase [Caulobacter sp. LARHSG274]
MKAVRIHEFGGPDVLRLEDLPTPDPARDEVLVQVRASSVNPVDYKIRRGGYLREDQLPLTLGRDIAGVVSRCGEAVTTLKPGDAVYAMLPRDKGGYAQFVSVPAALCAPKPARLDFVQAAAVPLAALTAWQGLFTQGGLLDGQTVLIHGASGGVGHFAVQLAAGRGAMVIATCAGQDHDFVRGLGAATVVDYKAQDFREAVRAVDLVLDLVGGETQDRSWDVVRRGGLLVSTVGEPDQAKAAAREAMGLTYLTEPDGAQLAQITGLIDERRIIPHIDRVFPLEASDQAERRLEREHVRGKIVLQVA